MASASLVLERGHFVSRFPDGAERHVVTDNGTAEIQCFVRYLDGRASYIDLRCDRSQEPVARSVRASLSEQLPRLPFTSGPMTSNCGGANALARVAHLFTFGGTMT
jgi:hypothetical protein